MMLERRQIVRMGQRGDAAALITLVRVEGSSYRRIGARMLVAADGSYVGSISGGCLEAEVARKAAWKVRHGAVVERFSTLFDDTAEIPYGLGCGGTVDLLFEPAGTPEFEQLMEALAASLNQQTLRVRTQLPAEGQPLRRFVLAANQQADFGAWPSLIDGKDQKELVCFEEWLECPQELVLFGAGDDAQPLVRMAALLGWSVTVVDGRAQLARRERFPEAARVIVANSLEQVSLGPRAAAVVMTHSYEQDSAWLTQLIPRNPAYLGLLGARHRSALLVAEVAARLGWSVDRVCAGLFAPVGLDLGGDGAETIALAVIAEIHAFCEGKLGTSRRMTAEVVAEQIAAGGASRYLQAQCAL